MGESESRPGGLEEQKKIKGSQTPPCLRIRIDGILPQQANEHRNAAANRLVVLRPARDIALHLPANTPQTHIARDETAALGENGMSPVATHDIFTATQRSALADGALRIERREWRVGSSDHLMTSREGATVHVQKCA